MKLDVGNESPQRSYESCAAGHSTPIHTKDYAFDIEDSPELDYRCSPVLLPCTQDGGNEIAWDWQTSGSKSSNDKSKPQNNHIETPKRTKQLQKKRNSNSPLLQKPLKRKQVKRENIENIGKLAAELQALSEKMKNMQENFKDDEGNNVDEQCESNKFLIKLDDDISGDIMADEIFNNEKSKVDSNASSSLNKQSPNYDDLFDDSVNDSMVKCSQEIEEKLNLCKSKQIDMSELSTISEKRNLSSSAEKESHCWSMSTISTETSKSSSTNRSSCLKTYSNNSSKTSSKLHVSMLTARRFNNNIANVSSEKQKLQDTTMSDFPDDSFDDCLATFMEDDKLVSKLSEYDFSPSKSGPNASHSRRTFKQAGRNTSNSEKRISKNLFSEPIVHTNRSTNSKNSILLTNELRDEVQTVNDNETMRKLFHAQNGLENRKFFKTKSLSDQRFYQGRNATTISKIGKISDSVAPSENRFPLNSVDSSVSTTFPIVRSQNSCKNNNFSSINGMENAHTLDRLEGKGAGNCIVKYNSTGNLCSTKEAKDSQSVQCTPEEIEQKRLEAKMKLEAKRKLQQTNLRIAGTPQGVPVKRSVKR